MPGRNHTVEAGFLDALPASYRDAAADLLHFYRLSQLLDMRQNGVYPEVQNRFDLKPIQWFEILDAVILTKVSYFDVTTQMSPKHIYTIPARPYRKSTNWWKRIIIFSPTG
jgi:hypothetical protein